MEAVRMAEKDPEKAMEKLAPSYDSLTLPENALPSKSLYGQIVEAKLESDSNPSFLMKTINIFFKTIGFIIVNSIALLIPITLIVLGALNLDRCPAQRFVPIWQVVGGATGVLSLLLSLYRSHQANRRNDATDDEQNGCSPIASLTSLLGLFNIAWFIAGSVWVFGIYQPNTSDEASTNYCDAASYYFGFVLLIITYSLMLFFCCCCCLCSCFVAKHAKNAVLKAKDEMKTEETE